MIKSVDICTDSDSKQYVSVEVDNGGKVEYLNFTEDELNGAFQLFDKPFLNEVNQGVYYELSRLRVVNSRRHRHMLCWLWKNTSKGWPLCVGTLPNYS